jgi:hypothetical protein
VRPNSLWHSLLASALACCFGRIETLAVQIFSGVTVFSYLLGNVASLIASLDPKSSMFTEKMLVINAYALPRQPNCRAALCTVVRGRK